MSILAIAFPVQVAVPVAEAVGLSVAGLARSVMGIGVFGAFLTLYFLFQPILKGLLRAAILLLAPVAAKSKQLTDRARSHALLNKLADEFESTQPSQAAEFRLLAVRD